jgi:hypothetical protein
MENDSYNDFSGFLSFKPKVPLFSNLCYGSREEEILPRREGSEYYGQKVFQLAQY